MEIIQHLVLVSAVLQQMQVDSKDIVGISYNRANLKTDILSNTSIPEVLQDSKIFNWFYFKLRYRFNKELFIKKVGNKYKNILLPINSSASSIYNILYKIYPNANFIFYEEGLLSYVKPVFSYTLAKIMKKHISYYIGYDILDNYLDYYLKFLNINKIDKKLLLGIFNKYRSKEIIKLDNKKKYCLFLPQYYFQRNKQKLVHLIHSYTLLFNKLIDEGYYIILKDHPKSSISILNNIKQKVNEDRLIIVNSNIIAEKLCFSRSPEILFSVYSTGLLSMSYFFGINAVSNRVLLNQRINYLSFYPTVSALLIKFFINHVKYGKIHENTNKTRSLDKIFRTNNFLFNSIIQRRLSKLSHLQ